jgi:hypothetical protein
MDRSMSGDQLRIDGQGDTAPVASSRDFAREHRFFEAISAGQPEFVQAAEQRLAVGEKEYGDSWIWVGIRHLLSETTEEAVDLAAWSALASEAVDRDSDLTDLHRQQIQAVLTTAARSGAAAYAALTLAHKSLEKRS